MFAPVGADGNGKSYRYATDAIPEDEEADEPKGVQFSNGGEPTKRYSSSEKESFWDKHKVMILVALVVLFALLFVVFAALYGKAMSDISNMGTVTTPRTGAIKVNMYTTLLVVSALHASHSLSPACGNMIVDLASLMAAGYTNVVCMSFRFNWGASVMVPSHVGMS